MENDRGLSFSDTKGLGPKGHDAKAENARPLDVLSGGERERLYQAEMLLAVSRKIAALETLDEILESLMFMTARELGTERCTLFLNDGETCELYARVAMGAFRHRIRMVNTRGIAGLVFTTGKGLIIHDAYADERFNRDIDAQTGFVTKNILCAPIRTARGEIIGVAQALNKQEGVFTERDMGILESMCLQAAVALQGAQVIEKMKIARQEEMGFFDVVVDITSEIDLGTLLQKVMGEATKMLHAERSTLFLNDEKTNELWSEVGEGIEATQIRFPNHLGIAGAVFTSGRTINIPHAYADLRFNPAFDRQTGFFTRSILCVPVANKEGRVIGVTQVLNRRGGPFTDRDESRLRAFTAQISIALENARLFNDIQNMKNYNESMLESMSNCVITLDEAGKIMTCNTAGLRILKKEPQDILSRHAKDFFCSPNEWIMAKIQRMEETGQPDLTMDAELAFDQNKISVNLSILPLVAGDKKKLGTLIMIEDISTEKRMKSTLSRYMDPGLADRVLDGENQDILGGRSIEATVLFSDIRGFTTLTETYGAQGTVSLLNEYFTIMVDCIQRESGMLDKFIGDAIMAGFGIPIPGKDDEDCALRAAISMITELNKWNLDRIKQGKVPVHMGIGLNTDRVVSGNIGSPKRMDFTMIGDGVNLAARLESACKQYFAQILISENTFNRLKGTYRIRDIDDVIVKGKTKPVRICEVLDHHTRESFPNLMEVVSHFKEGRNYYRRGVWPKAVKSFGRALELNPSDKLSQVFIDRCTYMMENPPENEWNGIWVMGSK
ncbi:MAG: GAF domain-containing protein [Proteobacteria bacterium]|nr:GAF domain-containing protein [Desulfobacula sp.]MBU3954025.1 GAF domain-containing protein [Pseudomonadota bacterium]MBU4129301.1 GAF domain-containing protein [Pseudomonadota bacterium]